MNEPGDDWRVDGGAPGDIDPYQPPLTQLPRDPLASMVWWQRLLLMVAAGIAYGLVMRVAFGSDFFGMAQRSGVMLVAFAVLVPVIVGMITVYGLAPERRGWRNVLFAPWLTTIGFAIGTAVTLLEGSICIAIMLPVFLLESSIGGLLMWGVLKLGQPSRGTTSGVLLLPLLVGAFESRIPEPDHQGYITHSQVIRATPQQVWQVLNDVRDIQPDEIGNGLAWRIGVPYPLQGVTREHDGLRVRESVWQNGIRFDEPIATWEPYRTLRWTYRFAPDSIPPHALDDHVAVGGHYFGLEYTNFQLTPVHGGTRVDMAVGYRVSTHFNGYADWWARRMLSDGSERLLAMYTRRAEAQEIAR